MPGATLTLLSTAGTGSVSVLAPACFVILSLSVYLVYVLYFHPLARYPGPFWGRVTQWYDVYHAYLGDKHVLLHELHQRYGTYVRYSPNTLSICDPAALHAIYAHGANVRKSEFYKCFRAAPSAISTLLSTEREHFSRKRRILAQAFSDQALKGLEQHVAGHIEELVVRIREATRTMDGMSKPVSAVTLEMQRWCNWLTFDIMGDLVFGKSFGTLGDVPQNREAIRLLGRAARRNYTVAAMPLLGATGIDQCLPFLRSLALDRRRFLAFGKRQVAERMRTPTDPDRKDIFTFLLHAKDPHTGEGMPIDELHMEGNTLIVAGSDTTATTLSATLHYLVANPSTLTRLTSEIRSTFPIASAIHSGDLLQSCSYLRACIDESMRLTPAVPGLLPREIQPGGLRIPALDLELPPGVIVGVPTYALHHSAAHISDPFRFDPGRWLKHDGEGEGDRSRDELMRLFAPFSLGPRACLGKPLVYLEVGLAIARLVWEFDLCASMAHRAGAVGIEREVRREGSWSWKAGEYRTKDWFLSSCEGPWVRISERRDGLRSDVLEGARERF